MRKFLSSKIGRWILLILILLLTILLVRSCSDSSLLQPGLFHIARLNSFYPIEMSGKEANLQAFIDELLTTVGNNEKLAIDIDTFRSDNLFEKLDNEEYDAILVTVTVDPFLKERYAISDPIFLAGPVLVVAAKSNISSLDDLKGRSIGVSKESTLIFRLASQHPDLQLVTYDNAISALNELDAGNVSGVIMEAQLAYTYTQALYSGKLKVATPQLVDLGIRLVTRKEKREEEFIEKFNRGLAQLKSSGEYDQLLKRWELVSSK